MRPHTSADDDWAESAAGREAFAAIEERVESATPIIRRRRRPPLSVTLPVAAVAAAAAAVLVVSLTSSSTTTSKHTPNNLAAPPLGSGLAPAAKVLEPFSSCDSLLSALRSHAEASVGPYGFYPYPFYPRVYAGVAATSGVATVNGFASTLDQGAVKSSPSGASSYNQFSTTNTQETGVDEPDVVKTSGKKVLVITDGQLRVIDASTRKVTGTLDLTMYDGWYDAQLMVSGSRAVVVFGGDNISSYTYSNFGGFYGYYGYGVPAGVRSTMLFVDFSKQPTVVGTLRTTGAYLDARMVGSTMRVVMNSAPDINFPAARTYVSTTKAKQDQTAKNKAVIENAPLTAWLPTYTMTSGTTTTTKTVSCDSISRPSDYTGASMVTTYSLDLQHLGADPNPSGLVADGDTVYASATSMYIASNATCAFCGVVKQKPTEIHRFDISGAGAPVYLGTASITGRLLSAYSVSEYNGSLRLAVTVGNSPKAQTNRIYVLDEHSLKLTGQITILARGEQIYAVRFLGAQGYVVTFRQTDPLYVVDLADPAKPRVTGQVKVTNYSTYLHDAGNGQLIGVGQALQGKYSEPAGVAVSLFDVSNPAKPKQLSQVVEPKTPSYGAVNPHAFLYWQPDGLIVAPIQTWAYNESGKALVVRLEGTKLKRVGVVTNPLGPSVSDDGQGVQRSLIVGGALWTVSGGGVLVSTTSALHRIAWIPFG